MSGQSPAFPEERDQHPSASIISAVLNVILAPMILGTCAVFMMHGLAFAMALGAMAGPVHTDNSIMLLATLPPALLSAILVRRTGVIPATLAGLIFSAPVLWICYEAIQESRQRHLERDAQVWYQVAYLTLVFATAASAFFALLARASREAKEANKAASH